jgi:hypothetical protein
MGISVTNKFEILHITYDYLDKRWSKSATLKKPGMWLSHSDVNDQYDSENKSNMQTMNSFLPVAGCNDSEVVSLKLLNKQFLGNGVVLKPR